MEQLEITRGADMFSMTLCSYAFADKPIHRILERFRVLP